MQPNNQQMQAHDQFQNVQEKINFVNSQIQLSQSIVKQGDELFNQFMFKQAKLQFVQASKLLLPLVKLTQDDVNFQNYIKKELKYSLDKAEKSEMNINTQLMSKNSAGYFGEKNLVKDSFQQLGEQLRQDAQNYQNIGKNGGISAAELQSMLQQQQLREDQNLQNIIPSPPTGLVQPKNQEDIPDQNQKKQPEKHKIDPEIMNQIKDSILDQDPNVKWDDIKGLNDVKKILNETIVLPTLRPDIFSGLYAPSKGILLYGPPGTGKTLLAKAVATECKSTFFSISASSLMSKWMGEGEKLMKALFQLAIEKAPSVIFFDEIDSIMGARGGNEHEASRRLKTEFLVQFDGVNGAAQSSDKSLLVLAATNRPQDLDEAALRRLTRRIYIPLPDEEARQAILESKLLKVNHDIDENSLKQLVKMTHGYSCADMQALIREAAMQPVRELPVDQILQIKDSNAIRKLQVSDFEIACKSQNPSVSLQTIQMFDDWRKEKGQIA